MQLAKAVDWDARRPRHKLQQTRTHLVVPVFHELPKQQDGLVGAVVAVAVFGVGLPVPHIDFTNAADEKLEKKERKFVLI